MIVDRRVYDLPVQRVPQQRPRFVPRAVPRGRAKQARRSVAVGSQMIIGRMTPAQLGELALSLKPPKWLRNAASSVFAKTDAKVSVPTPGGPMEVDLKNPDALQRIMDVLKNAKFQVSTGGRASNNSGNPLQDVDHQVQQNVPGGWGTVALGGLGLFALLLATRPRRVQTVQAA